MKLVTNSLLLGATAFAAPVLAQSNSWTQVGPTGVYTFETSPDYAVDGRVWIATGDFSYAGDGDVHLSTDHGASFALLSSLPGAAPETTALAVSPTFAQDSTLFAASIENLAPASTLWKSTDAGASWTAMPQPSALTWGIRFKTLALAPDYASMQLLLGACAGVGCHDQRSLDGGSTWTIVPSFRHKDLEFAPDFATSGLVYGMRSTGTNAFFRSDDFGANFWQCSHPLGNPGLCAYVEDGWGISVAPLGPQGERLLFYFGEPGTSGSNNLWRSDDGGDDWVLTGAGLTGLTVSDVVVPADFWTTGRLYAGTSDGVYVSDDAGSTFAKLVAPGLPSPVIKLELAGGPQGDLFALAGGTPDPQEHGNVVGGLADPHDVYRLRLAGTGVVDLANATAGVAGEPKLSATTDFGSNALALTLADAAPSAPTIHVFGFSSLFLSAFGGVVVPQPDIEVRFPTTPSGGAAINLAWPPITPAGFEVYVQSWIVDAAGPQGFAASNGLRLTRL